ncbi:MAG: helix-turn-helix transcriptional regulator [Micavibrio sp.]|nr:helix-turn-helix transcriptional regulator [Micavibrio sp.]
MSVQVSQIRAARAMLDWSQKDLADHAGISHVSIRNLENENNIPTKTTVDKIINALSLAGVVFIDSGVVLKKETVTTIEGEGWYLRLLDDVYNTLIDSKCEILFFCADDRASPPEVNNRIRKIRNAGIRMRQLVEDGNTYLMGPLNEYRYMPKERYTNYVSLVYGEKVAMCTDHNSKAIVFKDPMLSTMLTNVFDALWDTCKEPEKSNAPERF